MLFVYEPEELCILWLFDQFISDTHDRREKDIAQYTLSYLEQQGNFYKITKDSVHYTAISRVLIFARSHAFFDSIPLENKTYLADKLGLISMVMNSSKKRINK